MLTELSWNRVRLWVLYSQQRSTALLKSAGQLKRVTISLFINTTFRGVNVKVIWRGVNMQVEYGQGRCSMPAVQTCCVICEINHADGMTDVTSSTATLALDEYTACAQLWVLIHRTWKHTVAICIWRNFPMFISATKTPPFFLVNCSA